MDFDTWNDWTLAHRRDGEDVGEAAKRLAVTYAFVESRNRPNSEGAYRRIMAAMLKMPSNNGAGKAKVQRRIARYKLMELEL